MSNILGRGLHSSGSGGFATSVVATNIPGRIYVEAGSFAEANKLARFVAELDPMKVSPVLQGDVFKILNFSYSHTYWPWARVRGNRRKWAFYAGDTGLITKVEGHDKEYLALIPRIASEGQSRPPQALISRSSRDVRSAARDEANGRFSWKGHLFSAEGLSLVDLTKIATLPVSGPLPSFAELALFRTTSVLSTAEAERTEQRISQGYMKSGDKVKVIAGPYVSLLGEIREIKENEVAVYLPSQNVVENMTMDFIRVAFAISDQVRVLEGPSQSVIGWVVDISVNTLRVVNVEAQIEVDDLNCDMRQITNFSFTGQCLEIERRVPHVRAVHWSAVPGRICQARETG